MWQFRCILLRLKLMNRKYKPAYQALKVLGVPVFTNTDNDKLGNFFIDGEARNSDLWLNYHFPPSEFIFGVHPAVESLLAQFGLRCEWVNPSLLGVYEA
jgi:hypothetical protein